jgi:hypothetical protein
MQFIVTEMTNSLSLSLSIKILLGITKSSCCSTERMQIRGFLIQNIYLADFLLETFARFSRTYYAHSVKNFLSYLNITNLPFSPLIIVCAIMLVSPQERGRRGSGIQSARSVCSQEQCRTRATSQSRDTRTGGDLNTNSQSEKRIRATSQ